MLRLSAITYLILITSFSLFSQENGDPRFILKVPDDTFGISYGDVFDNMHYNQPYRPQVHYTPVTGQIADATGLILYKGTYHLFNMFDEWSNSRGYNKNWGHAVSNDLIFWEQKPPVLNTVLDNRPGSGSGIVDWNNTLGLQSGPEQTLVIFYTDFQRGVCLAISRDAGKTWVRHKDNPVIPMPEEKKKNPLRDPFVFWYKPDQSWRMALYEEPGYTFYKSKNLLEWEQISKIEGFYECPDLLQIAVDGDANNKKWVIIDGNGSYRIGEFNGTAFISNMKNEKIDFGGDLYATQTWKQSYEGDGPFYQVAFLMYKGLQTSVHDRTWTNLLSFPCELTLKTINGKIRLCRNPVTGLKSLRNKSWMFKDIAIKSEDNPITGSYGDVMEIIIALNNGKSKGWDFNIRGNKIHYSADKKELSFNGNTAKINSTDNQVNLHIIVDRSSFEIFVNKGEVCFSNQIYPDVANKNIQIVPEGGPVLIKNLEVYTLNSIWVKREQELGYYREK